MVQLILKISMDIIGLKKDFSKVKNLKNKNIKYFDTAENYKSYYELKKIINAKS